MAATSILVGWLVVLGILFMLVEVRSHSAEEVEISDLERRIADLGTPYFDDSDAPHNASMVAHIRRVIFNQTADLISQINWDDAVRELDFTPKFVLSLDGVVKPNNLTLLEATMFSFTASTDMVIAISEIPQLRSLMNTSNKAPAYPSLDYLQRYLRNVELEPDDVEDNQDAVAAAGGQSCSLVAADEGSSCSDDTPPSPGPAPFRLRRFSAALELFLLQIAKRLDTPRGKFVKAVSEYVSSLHDCFKVVENVPADEADEEEDWLPLPTSAEVEERTEIGPDGFARVRPDRPRMYRIVGPTRREVNSQLSKLVVSYFYLPLIAAAYERALVHMLPDLPIEDDHTAERRELLSRLAKVQRAEDKQQSQTDMTKSTAGDAELERRRQRFTEHAAVVVSTAETLWELYNATDGRNWQRQHNWFCYPFTSSSEKEAAGRVDVEAGRILLTSREGVRQHIESDLLLTHAHAQQMLAYIERTHGEHAEADEPQQQQQHMKSKKKNKKSKARPKAPTGTVAYDVPEEQELPLVMAAFFAHWDGLLLERSSGRVVMLDLMGNGLRGRLPASLLSLTGDSLVHVELSRNQLSGPIPDAFRTLARLTTLGLNDNKFTGSLPQSLYGGSSGTVVGTKTKEGAGGVDGGALALSVLRLHNNELTGTLPAHLARLKNLTLLNLSHNKFRGALPASLGKQLQELRSLDVSHNLLSRSVPPTLTRLSSLQLLVLEHNKLSGELPMDLLVRLSQLRELKLQHNRLSGILPIPTITPIQQGEEEVPAPPSFFAAQLEQLLVHDNYLTGTLSPYISAFSALQVLDAGNNRLTGSLPLSIKGLRNLTTLVLPRNRLNGTVHGGLSSLAASLLTLDLSSNQLAGALTASLFELENLSELRLDDNRFSGRIPKSVGELEQLRTLTLSRNKLTGPIPARIAALTNLEVLQLHENRLTGSLPSALFSLTALRSLVLADNSLSGSLKGVAGPEGLAGLTQLEELVLHGNDGLQLPAKLNSRSLHEVLPRCVRIEL